MRQQQAQQRRHVGRIHQLHAAVGQARREQLEASARAAGIAQAVVVEDSQFGDR
jgi:hypothetical protein